MKGLRLGISSGSIWFLPKFLAPLLAESAGPNIFYSNVLPEFTMPQWKLLKCHTKCHRTISWSQVQCYSYTTLASSQLVIYPGNGCLSSENRMFFLWCFWGLSGPVFPSLLSASGVWFFLLDLSLLGYHLYCWGNVEEGEDFHTLKILWRACSILSACKNKFVKLLELTSFVVYITFLI